MKCEQIIANWRLSIVLPLLLATPAHASFTWPPDENGQIEACHGETCQMFDAEWYLDQFDFPDCSNFRARIMAYDPEYVPPPHSHASDLDCEYPALERGQ